MAGLTAVVSRTPNHPVHSLVRTAVQSHGYRPVECLNHEWTSPNGFLSVISIIPIHLVPGEDQSHGGDSFRILQPVAISGTDIPEGISVDYEEPDRLTLRTDRANRAPVFHFLHPEYAIFTTELRPLFVGGIIPFAWDERGLVSSLLWNLTPFPGTLFQDVRMVKPGRAVCVRGTTTFHPPDGTETPREGSLDEAVDTYARAVVRAYESEALALTALSGGWDTRAALAALLGQNVRPRMMTFGVQGSTDVDIARSITDRFGLEHERISLDDRFPLELPVHVDQFLLASNGMADPFSTHESFVHRSVREHSTAIIDSAGCEFRRGYNLRLRMLFTRSPDFGIQHFLSVYRTEVPAGVFTRCEERMRDARLRFRHIAEEARSANEAVDTLFSSCVWNAHYANSFYAQSHLIRGRMPMYDEDVHPRYTSLPDRLRWGKAFQRRVIARYYPRLLDFPISHGGIRLPAWESPLPLIPVYAYRVFRTMVRRFGGQLPSEVRSHLDYPAWVNATAARMRDDAEEFLRRHSDLFRPDASASLANPTILLRVYALARTEGLYRENCTPQAM